MKGGGGGGEGGRGVNSANHEWRLLCEVRRFLPSLKEGERLKENITKEKGGIGEGDEGQEEEKGGGGKGQDEERKLGQPI